MKYSLAFLYCFSLSNLYAQVEFYECPKEKKYQNVSNARVISKKRLGSDSIYLNLRIDTGNLLVLKYEQIYDCSETGHFAVIAFLIWTIPMNITKFEIELNNADSLQSTVIYLTSCGPPCKKYNFEMTSAKGHIQGSVIDNIWYVKGKIDMLLQNKALNISVSKDLIIDGTYKPWKQNRKDRNGHKFNGF
ncbi:MAG: hypothetical protein ACHQFX_14555 [Chitinophagales bacterium]